MRSSHDPITQLRADWFCWLCVVLRASLGFNFQCPQALQEWLQRSVGIAEKLASS